MTDCATAYTCAFIRSAFPPNCRRVLEIGCGAGALASALGAIGFEVVAIDSDPEAVTQAKAAGVDAQVAEWPRFSAGMFDAVLFTRSLHHIGPLHESVAAAFVAMRDDGRVIVEDFKAEGASAKSTSWFRSTVAALHRAGKIKYLTPYLAEILSDVSNGVEDLAHKHQLHSSIAIEAALRSIASFVLTEESACYFRYLSAITDTGPELAAAMLDMELDLMATGKIDALGRRYVASRSPL